MDDQLVTQELKPCPWCEKPVMHRHALHVSDGNTDDIIHAEPTDCGMEVFSIDTADRGVSVGKAWNTRLTHSPASDVDQAKTVISMMEGLHALIFGTYAVDDPQFSHGALADEGQIHEYVHTMLRELPSRAALRSQPTTPTESLIDAIGQAYRAGWQEGCEDYDAAGERPHFDAMNEGAAEFTSGFRAMESTMIALQSSPTLASADDGLCSRTLEEAANDDLVNSLIEALEFYADPETYHACAFAFDPPTGGFDEDFDADHGHEDYDRPMPGKLARLTLANLKPKPEGQG